MFWIFSLHLQLVLTFWELLHYIYFKELQKFGFTYELFRCPYTQTVVHVCQYLNCMLQMGLLLMLLAQVILPASGSYHEADASACSRKNSQWPCVMGCFKCADFFGRKSYDMAACCGECQQTGALIIDDGPEFCSLRFFTATEFGDYVKGKRHI